MWPSTPLSVNSGMKPTIMIAAEKKMARLTSVAARKIVANFPLKAERGRSLGPIKRRAFRKMSKDVFHHDDASVDDVTEIDCPHRQQIGGFSTQYQDADREEEGEGNGR